MASYITEEDVRNYILDRTLEDNELQLDLTFSPEDISNAMVRAARDYNSLPPFVGGVEASKLPNDTNMFLDGIAAQLYISRLSKLSRNDMDYTAGNVTTNIVQKQIGHLQNLIKMHRDFFREAALAQKVFINHSLAWGQIG